MRRTVSCLGLLPFLAALILVSTAYAYSPENTRFKGDLRLRYQYEHTEGTEGLLQRHRGRFRFRFGFATMMREDLEIGGRLATGDTDPRSTNQTTTGFFSTKDIRLDKAYVFWSATDNVTLKVGKYGGAFLVTGDMLWDSDITFEGASVSWKRPLGGGSSRPDGGSSPRGGLISPLVNAGTFVLNEDKTSGNDPQMYLVQPGLSYDSKALSLETGVALYIFEHLKGSSPDEDISSVTNTRVDGKLKYDYDSVNPVLVLIYRPGGSGEPGHVLKILGDYIYNIDSKDSGYRLGLVFGSPKVKEAGSWQVHYAYRRLERDAFPDVFPDSDFYGGATDVAGHEAIVHYGLAKNVSVGLDYYNARRIEDEDQPQNLLQVDCCFKF
jgi:hypothetical protein